MKVAVIQMASGEDKLENLEKAARMIREAGCRGAELAVLPELFNFLPHGMARKKCLPNAEGEDGETLSLLRDLARETGVKAIIASIIEKDGQRLYNTAYALTEEGVAGKYRKNHLFSYGKIREGEVFTPGEAPAVVDINGLRIGMTICYDLRFPELFRYEALSGAEAIVNVAAFLEETGRAHWLTLLRARAIENMSYIIAANQAGTQSNEFKYHGHSCIIDPWGRVLRRAGKGEEVITGAVQQEKVRVARDIIPVLRDYREY